jgi:hypothetical protein
MILLVYRGMTTFACLGIGAMLLLTSCGRSGFPFAFEDDGAPIGGKRVDAGRVTLDAATIDCWDPNFSQRQRLSFDNSAQAESLTEFAVLVSLNASNIDYSQTQNSGQDLRFVDGDGTVLAHEIESWNEAGDSFVWVKVPEIDGASSTDFVYMLYGNASAPDGQAVASVWSADYLGVWHLAETSGPLVDSTNAISCPWLGGGSGTQDAAGRIGGANEFDGAEDSADCGAGAIPDLDASTVTAWVNLPLTGDVEQQVVCIESTSSPYRGLGLYVHRMNGAIGTWHNNNYVYASESNNLVTANEWSFLAMRSSQAASGGSIEVSKNGGAWETIASGDTSDLQIEASTRLILGKWPGGGPGASTRGLIDEIRISGAARSDDWIRANYLSMTQSFVSFAADPQDCP